MAGIKISDLPPNTLPLVGDEQLELEDAAGDSTRATVADIASSAAGLDATFVTVSLNAALPNERVITEGTNITIVDGGPGSTITISAAGTSFPLLAPSGSAAAPSYAFTDGDSGFFEPLDDNIQISLVGTARFFWELDTYNAVVGTGPAMVNIAASSTDPGFVPRRSDPNTGLGSAGSDILSLIAGGVSVAQVTSVGNNQFAIAQSGSSSVPDLTSLADTDTGFRWPANNETVWIGGGSRSWNFSTAKFYSQFSNGPALMNEISSDVNPTVVPDHSDPNTGMGHPSGSDELSFIAGGIEAIRIEEVASFVTITYFGTLVVPTASAGAASVGFDGDLDTGYFSPVGDAFAITAGGIEGTRWAEAGGSIIKTDQNDVAIVASTTQTQGQQPLLSSYNEITSVANPNDVVTAPLVSAGMRLIIINNGGNPLQVFPALGDNIGGGVDGSITVGTGATGIFLGRDGTDWDTLYNDVPSPSSGAVVPDPLLLSSGGVGVPTYSYAADTDTGVFNPALDILGFSAGGILGLSLAEVGSHVIQTNEEHVGLTASVTQTQAGGLALLSSYNEIATVGTTGDALTAFDVAVGERLVVINNGVNDLQLFPALGDDIGAGVDTAITIIAGELGIFIGRDAVNWDTLYNAPPTPSVSFPLLAPDGTAGAPSYSFSGDTDMGMFRLGAFLTFTVGGTAQWGIDGTALQGIVASAPLFRNLAATATVPNITISSADINTGLGSAGVDILSLIAGGVQIAQAVEAVGANQFIVAPGVFQNVPATPSLAFGDGDSGFYEIADDNLAVSIAGVLNTTFAAGTMIVAGTIDVSGGDRPRLQNLAATLTVPNVIPFTNDLDTGIGADGADRLALIAGGVSGVNYAEASSRIIQINANHVGLTASVTQTQVGGLALLSSYNEVLTVANVGDALTAFAVEEGSRLIVVNNGANELQLFPASGDNFGAGVDLSITVDSGEVAVFIGRNATNWDTLFNSNPNINFPGGATVSGVWQFDSSTVEADPGSGNFRNNNATIASVTEVFISSITETNTDADNILGLLGNGDQLYIQNLEDATEFMLFDITANVDNVGWFSIAGTVSDSNANFTNGEKFGVLLLFGGTGAPAVPVANDAVQARRTTSFTLTTAFVDVTLDTTDIETDSAVLNHDLVTNTDNIIAGAAGTYEVTYDFDGATSEVAGDDIIDINARVRLNDAGVDLPGSLAIPRMVRDGSIGGANGQWQIHCSNTFIVTLSASDFLTMQLSKTELAGVGVFTCERISIKVRRLL